MGDFVDRGFYSVETFLLLLALKVSFITFDWWGDSVVILKFTIKVCYSEVLIYLHLKVLTCAGTIIYNIAILFAVSMSYTAKTMKTLIIKK